jgi:hypothetical protein
MENLMELFFEKKVVSKSFFENFFFKNFFFIFQKNFLKSMFFLKNKIPCDFKYSNFNIYII